MWMSTLSGHRRAAGVAAAIAAAAIATAPILGAGAAYAADGQTVSFAGGSVAGLLVCKSAPSSSLLNLASESRVMFANRLGQAATLRVDGQAVATVGPNQAVPVVFHYGPVSVSMTFSCGAGVVEKFSATSVDVAPPARPATPSGSRPSAGVVVGSPTHSKPGTTRAGATAGRTGTSTGQAGTEGTAGGTAGVDPLNPAASGGLPSADPSAIAGDPATIGGGKAGAAVAVGPLVPASGPARESASGLLALLAAVCAVGVTAAAIRAIISKRTIQARLA
jgi:hypothetical protein